MGMVRAALAEPDGMIILIIVWIKYMIPSERTRPASLIRPASEWRIGSMIWPSCKIMIIPPAKPTTSAAERISFTPAIKSLTMLSAFSFAAKPESIPMARNSPDISGKYHP